MTTTAEMTAGGGGDGIIPSARTPWTDALVLTASGDAAAGAMWLGMARDADVGGVVREGGSKRPAGFLRAAGDLLRAMGEHTKVYLDPLLSLALVLLEEASEICENAAAARLAAAAEYRAGVAGSGGEDGMDVDGVVEDENEIDDDVDDDEDDDDDDDDDEKKKNKKDKGGSAARGKSAASSSSSSRDAREVRVLAVRFLGALFARHPGFDYSAYWPMVLKALSPMAARMAAESGAAAPPPALAVVAALADDERLAPLLTTSGGAVGWCKSELV